MKKFIRILARMPQAAAMAVLLSLPCSGQQARKDSACYAEKTIWGEQKTVLTFDLSGIVHPGTVSDFKPVFHFPPVRQDTTSTCWCFSGTSFLESELYRIHGRMEKLSEMYTVYWEYVEKARRYVREKGNSEFGEGSEQEAVMLRIREYGAVRAADYTGLLNGRTRHNHEALFDELQKYLRFVKTNGLWDEGTVLGAVRLVLDKHLGKPPESIVVGGKRMTPKEFAEQELRLPLDEYVSFQSCLSAPFHQKAEFKVPDNWWHSREYTNLPLGEWDQALRDAIRRGYSVAIGGDVSEPGKDRDTGLAVVPDFDLPAWAVDQSARELRIYNKTTEDDHGVHIIGSARAGGHDWFLVKDSGASGHEGPFKGYMFFRDDFVRLKMLTFTVHRNAVKEVLRKCESR